MNLTTQEKTEILKALADIMKSSDLEGMQDFKLYNTASGKAIEIIESVNV